MKRTNEHPKGEESSLHEDLDRLFGVLQTELSEKQCCFSEINRDHLGECKVDKEVPKARCLLLVGQDHPSLKLQWISSDLNQGSTKWYFYSNCTVLVIS